MTTFRLYALLAVCSIAPNLVAAIDSVPSAPLASAASAGDSATVESLIKKGADPNEAQADGSTPLHWAVWNRDTRMAGALMAAGAHVNVANSEGETPLTLALRSEDIAMAEVLLKGGADPNTRRWTGETPLMRAALDGAIPMAELLIRYHADVNLHEQRYGQTALMWAAAEAHTDMVTFLLGHGADPVALTSVLQVPIPLRPSGRDPIGEYTEPKGGRSALFFAVESGCLECVKLLVAAGDDVNRKGADGITPLLDSLLIEGKPLVDFPHEQAPLPKVDIARWLVDHGADVNAKDLDGFTPLAAAIKVRLGHNGGIYDAGPLPAADLALSKEQIKISAGIPKYLIDHGADPNIPIIHNVPVPTAVDPRSPTNYVGMTPFFLALMTSDSADAKLMAKTVDPNAARPDGMTALMLAAQSGDPQTVEAILALGGDVNRVYKGADGADGADDNPNPNANGRNGGGVSGSTAAHFAARSGSAETLKLLTDHGARMDVKDSQGNTPADLAKLPPVRRRGGGGLQPPAPTEGQ
jgi:ankyrin repeat protein